MKAPRIEGACVLIVFVLGADAKRKGVWRMRTRIAHMKEEFEFQSHYLAVLIGVHRLQSVFSNFDLSRTGVFTSTSVVQS